MAKKPAPKKDADTNGTNAPDPNAQVQLNTLAQYVKDYSFENPRAPMSLQGQQEQPEINISVNVNAQAMGETEYEVSIKLEAEAKAKEDVLFNVELLYAGVFRITGIPAEHVHPVVLIECPRLLFPFARQIVAEGTRDGGFPPLMIDPVDFAALYRQRVAQEGNEGEATN